MKRQATLFKRDNFDPKCLITIVHYLDRAGSDAWQLTCLTALMLQEQQLSSVVRSGPGEEQQGGQQQSWQRAEHTEVLLWKTNIGQP